MRWTPAGPSSSRPQSKRRSKPFCARRWLMCIDTGVCEFTDETDALVERLSVCGFAVQDEAPSLIVRAAAERVLEELARGSGCEDDPAEIYYPDLLAAIMIYVDACHFSDAHVCGVIEAAYRRVSGRRPASTPYEPPASLMIVLH